MIEAGFPITSRGEFEAVRRIAGMGLRARVCALARAVKEDMDLALEAGVDRVHVFIATSDLHLKYKLNMSREEALSRAVWAVEYLKSHGVEVEFSAEDATRTDPEYLVRIYSAVAEAGADYLDIPDTVGTATPERFGQIVGSVVKVSRGRVVSVHCHNDFGLATANTIAGILAGARQAHVTINGIGERAGNTSLEEVVMALKLLYGFDLGVRTEKIVEVSRLVSRLTGVPVQPNKAIVGRNAFGHESGIHTHGILRNPATYEAFPPEMVGARRWLAVGKHAGSHGIRARLRELGFDVSDEQLKAIVRRVKDLGDAGKRVGDDNLVAIASEVTGLSARGEGAGWVERLEIFSSATGSEARVRIGLGKRILDAVGRGGDMVEAVVDAVEKILSRERGLSVKGYSIEVLPEGGERSVEATAVVENHKGLQFSATSIRRDPPLAVAEALVRAASSAALAERTSIP